VMKYKKFGTETMKNELENKLKELCKGYLNKLKGIFLDFSVLIDEEPINIQEVYSKVHTISGTSGMYGLSDLSNTSTEFEIYLKPLKENPESINAKELKNKFSIYLKDIEQILSRGE